MLAVLFSLAAGAMGYLYYFRGDSAQLLPAKSGAGAGMERSSTVPPPSQAISPSSMSTPQDQTEGPVTPTDDGTTAKSGTAIPAGQIKSSSEESATSDAAVSESAENWERSLGTISNFYRHLDTQEYLKPYQLDAPSEKYFSALLQKVVDNPPIVSGETDDLFSILQNTAHFFRIVGKKNIYTLKAILDREKDSFENVLAEFYKMTSKPEKLKERYGLTIPDNALYDYAGFFLNTMGGRLYLFRRDSISRMAVSYYSILIVDEANNNGTNKHGIDIAPAIDLLISDLENSGSQLRMKDDYLNTLYDLQEKYHP